jgi:type IV pilus assembly protein PilM
MSVLTSWLASPAPDAAIEIAPEAVSVAAVTTRGRDAIVQAYAIEPLPAGAVVPALTTHNIVNREPVVRALQTALERAAIRPRRVAVIVPDAATRVSLVRFDRVPERREDLEQLVRWQLKKAAPFPIDEASLSYVPGARTVDGGEFVVVMARHSVVREYEVVCEDVGLHAGLVDIATFGVLNLFLASEQPKGDWLAVHVRPDYLSLAIMRGDDVIFFRSRAESDDESLADVVHQTSMYYQDRLAGQGFSRVLLGGIGRAAGALEMAQQSIEDRLGVGVERIDPTRMASLTDRISISPDVAAMLAPLVGTLLRTRREAAVA